MSLLARISRNAALPSLVRRVAPVLSTRRGFMSAMEDYGKNLFKGDVADKYLAKQGLPAGLLDDPSWTSSPSTADSVAKAIMEWAGDNGASVFTHWFQPLGASGVRMPGMTGQVHNAFFSFGKDGKPLFEFKGKELLKGETDGSSYPSGGLRATHTAGGYTVLDPTSPVFLRGDTVYVPTVFVSFYGQALDEKTPLMRSMAALSKEGVRLCKNLGLDVSGVSPNIGLEQECFFVPRSQFYRRPDLQLTGRTIMGKNAPRGQEMCDHYMKVRVISPYLLFISPGLPLSKPCSSLLSHPPSSSLVTAAQRYRPRVHEGDPARVRAHPISLPVVDASHPLSSHHLPPPRATWQVLPHGHPAAHAPLGGRTRPVRVRPPLRHCYHPDRSEYHGHADHGGGAHLPTSPCISPCISMSLRKRSPHSSTSIRHL